MGASPTDAVALKADHARIAQLSQLADEGEIIQFVKVGGARWDAAAPTPCCPLGPDYRQIMVEHFLIGGTSSVRAKAQRAATPGRAGCWAAGLFKTASARSQARLADVAEPGSLKRAAPGERVRAVFHKPALCHRSCADQFPSTNVRDYAPVPVHTALRAVANYGAEGAGSRTVILMLTTRESCVFR